MSSNLYFPAQSGDRAFTTINNKIYVDGSGSITAQDSLYVSASNVGRGAYKLTFNQKFPAADASYLKGSGSVPSAVVSRSFQPVSDPFLGCNVTFIQLTGSAAPAAMLQPVIVSSSLEVSTSFGGFSLAPAMSISGSIVVQLLTMSGSAPGAMSAIAGLAASGSAIQFNTFLRNTSTPRKGV